MPRLHRDDNPLTARRRSRLRVVRRARIRKQIMLEARKASAFSAVDLLNMSSDTTGGRKRDYAAFAREAYMRCVIAYRCVTLISRGIGIVPWYVTINGDIVENPNEPLTKLIRRPNPDQGTSAYFEELSAWLLIAGNSYTLRSVATEKLKLKAPRALELNNLRPDRVTANADKKTGQITSYTYQYGKQKTDYPVNPITHQSNVLHLKTFNPSDDIYGLGPTEPAAYGIDQHNAGNEWNYRLLKHSAKPSGAIEYDPGESGAELTDEQRDRLKRQLNARHEGEMNVGRTLLLENYMKWRQMGLSPMDMDFSNTMASAARQIANAWGVPPMLVNVPGDATYANYKEARLALWEDTIVPLANYIRDELNNWLVMGFGDSVLLDYDLDAVPALAEKRVALWDKLVMANFLQLNEKREAAGYDELDGGDVLLIPMGVTPLETSEDEDGDDDIPEGAEDLEPEEAGKMAYGR